MIPQRYANLVFALLLSGIMSFIVSGLSTFRAAGWTPEAWMLWLGNWVTSWAIAFPIVVVVAPLVRRIVARLTMPQNG